MHIERSQSVGKEEAMRRIDVFVDGWMRRAVPGGISVQDASKVWTDNVLRLSATAKKMFFSVPLSATVTVEETSVALDSELPGLVTAMLSADKIEALVGKELDALLRP